jgi:hypothetical protein
MAGASWWSVTIPTTGNPEGFESCSHLVEPLRGSGYERFYNNTAFHAV